MLKAKAWAVTFFYFCPNCFVEIKRNWCVDPIPLEVKVTCYKCRKPFMAEAEIQFNEVQ